MVATLALTADAFAAPPQPFGHSCQAQNGVRFCPTTAARNGSRPSTGFPSTST